ncbi:GTP-binding protein [Arthrobacter ulcerisalmonis]|nr:GTP-binding protein [Arthrobacter ulcerisalmonis]
MDLLLISSLDGLCRQQACEEIAAAHPGSVLVVHDLLEDGLVIRRIYQDSTLVERTETTLEHGCLSCVLRLDLVPTVERLLKDAPRPIVVSLPPTVPAALAVDALNRGLGHAAEVAAVVVACAADALEDHLWDAHTLFESGFTPIASDDRTAGEFLLGELDFAETVLLAAPEIVPVNPADVERGRHLLRELAAHAHLAEKATRLRPGRFNYATSLARTLPGAVHPPRGGPRQRSAAASKDPKPRQPAAVGPGASPFTTVFHSAHRPLHPGRFREALGSLAAGCCVLRGHVWMASAPECRIAVQGIGPRVWLENIGAWPAKSAEMRDGGHSTAVSATGEGLDAAEIFALLTACELTDAEMSALNSSSAANQPLEKETP